LSITKQCLLQSFIQGISICILSVHVPKNQWTCQLQTLTPIDCSNF